MPGGHYFDIRPKAASRPAEVELVLPGFRAAFATDRGVFSHRRVDPGTIVLLRESPLPPADGNLLDLGCGYGAIACWLASGSRHASVWAVDVNERALALTADNAKRLGVSVRVAKPEDVPSEVRFNGIWSNPPVRIGKEALHSLFAAWLPRLESGSAWVVMQRNLGADSLAAWLDSHGWETERVASKRGYRVLRIR